MKRLISTLAAVALLAAAYFGFRWFAFGLWESTLMGPYTGAPFTGTLPPQPASRLQISREEYLEFYEVPGATVPVLVFRRGGAVQWARLLLPQHREPDGSTTMAAVRGARFDHRVLTRSGIRVMFTCDWDWGGREAGLVYLASDKSFDHFGISW